MEELTNAITLHSSNDGESFNPVINGIDICRSCGKRTLVCPHKFPKDQVIELPAYCTHIKAVHVEPDMRITMSTERNARMGKITDNIKFTVLESITALEEVWEEIGLSENGKVTRHATILDHVQDLLKEMLAEEDELKQKMKIRANEYKQEALQLYNDLGLDPKEVICDVLQEKGTSQDVDVKNQLSPQMSLMQMEGAWRTEVDLMNKEKHDRMKQLKRLRTDEEKLCERLVMPQHELTFTGCPTLDQLRELEQNVKFLKGEQSKRLELFLKLQASVKQLWCDLDVEPSAEIEVRMVATDAEETFILSKQNLDDLTELQKKLEQEHTDLIQQIDGLREKAKSLWERLETPVQEQKLFLNKLSTNSPKVAKMLIKEIERLEELKRQHMEKFVTSIRKELVDLWDKCFFGEDQRKLFVPFYSDVFTEETLAEHEHQVATVKNYYEENKEIFKLAEKRQNLWKKKIEFENRSGDSNRLNNRGGALLKEEKLRKAVVKELPKIENEIRKKIKVWEKENETYFMFNGARYVDFIDQEKEDYESEQKLKKEEKLRAKQEELNQEAVFGSTSRGGPKRKVAGTPGKSFGKSSKLARMDVTHGTPNRIVHSSICPSPRRPKTGVENKRQQGVVAKKTAAKKNNKIQTEARRKSLRRRSNRLANAKKRVLADRTVESNMVFQDSRLLDDSKVVSGSSFSKPNPNMSSLCSYNDFTSAVAESPYSRSSFMCSKSTNGNDRTPNMFNFTGVSSNSAKKSTLRSGNRTLTEKSTKQFRI